MKRTSRNYDGVSNVTDNEIFNGEHKDYEER